MSLRPRYSLLALLLFTAFVAGGVKLWYGPHHVINRSNPQMEDEYTYYRDWDGTKIMDGVRVLRYFQPPDIMPIAKHPNATQIAAHPVTATLIFFYYRNGERLSIEKSLVSVPTQFGPYDELAGPMFISNSVDTLLPAEQITWAAAIQKERQRYTDRGGFVWTMQELAD